ncbi:MAG: ABC transporter substrate-binding protein [Nitrososphaeria archaeon]
MYSKSKLGISTPAAAVAIVLLIVGVAVGYLTGSAMQPSATTVTSTVTSTVGTRETVTLTQTTTQLQTVTQTVTQVTTTTPTEVKKLKDTITIGTTERLQTTLDPANAVGWFAVNILYNVGRGLVSYEAGTDKIVPEIATSWTISPDGTEYIFNLRKDVKFSNGHPVTAKTFEFSLRRAIELKGPPTFFIRQVVDKPEDVTALDDYTLRIKLKYPFAPFLSMLAISAAPTYPVDPSVVKPNEFYTGIYIGPGPYQIAEHVQDVMIRLTPNPYYYGEPPATPNIIIKQYRDPSAMALALRTKEIDLVMRGGLTPSDINVFKQNPDFEVKEAPLVQMRGLMLNTALPPLNDIKVRQAIAYALDRSEIVDGVFQGTVLPLYSIIPRGISGGVNYFHYIYGEGNIESAKKLLREAGYSETNKATIEITYDGVRYGVTEHNTATIIKKQLEATGLIEVKLNPVETAKFTQLYLGNPYPGLIQSFLYGWWADYLDPDDYIWTFYQSSFSALIGTYVNNTAIEPLLIKQRSLLNFEERFPLIIEVQKLGAEHCSTIPLWQPTQIAIHIKGLEGVVLGPDGSFRFWTYSLPA